MTDLERTEQHFQSLGYTLVEDDRTFHHLLEGKQYNKSTVNGEIQMTFGDGGRKYGYSCFGFCLVFDREGKFIGHGAFE